MSNYYDRDLNPIDSWNTRSTDWAGRRVLKSTVGAYQISTVWLALDHGYYGAPIVFETMVFGPPGTSGGKVFCERHESEEVAARFHLSLLDRMRAGYVPSYDDE